MESRDTASVSFATSAKVFSCRVPTMLYCKTLHYEKISSSEEVKGIDLDLLLRSINMVSHVDAIKMFQQALQK
ncbi:hypothetical protein MiSe_11270 [Microseira wollei NIES-4236]|uniref:Uncharacterized protein n=1 Tax=Microseira wollei NIES-4236 TaxID=2530354 RepID=A0AAV3X104_9CYAN|nr:hypothetical protein MiSe_11270 [Microseira wollei NIES-4236]